MQPASPRVGTAGIAERANEWKKHLDEIDAGPAFTEVASMLLQVPDFRLLNKRGYSYINHSSLRNNSLHHTQRRLV